MKKFTKGILGMTTLVVVLIGGLFVGMRLTATEAKTEMDKLVQNYEAQIDSYKANEQSMNNEINHMKEDNEALGEELTKLYNDEGEYKLQWSYDGDRYIYERTGSKLLGKVSRTKTISTVVKVD